MIFNEATQLIRVTRKDQPYSILMEWTIFLTFGFFLVPRHVLTKPVLEASGMPKNEYPILHSVLFEHRASICLIMSIIIVVWFCTSLKRRALRYQFSRFGFAIITGLITSLNMVGGQQQYQLGIFWAIFVPTVIACNDSFAYICGKTLGRTPLIKLSPNKTLEGFLGGALATFVLIYLVISSFFGYKSLICVNYRLDRLPFQQIECNS